METELQSEPRNLYIACQCGQQTCIYRQRTLFEGSARAQRAIELQKLLGCEQAKSMRFSSIGF